MYFNISNKHIIRKIILSLFFLISVAVFASYGQISLKYLNEKRTEYKAGDKIELLISLKTLLVTCKDGLDKVKIYVSGLSISEQSEWKKISTSLWQKNIKLEVLKISKNQAKLTILRKVDKEDLYYQELFKIAL